MENSYKFFCNKDCKYFPCHEGFENPDNFNCLFCYCPLNARDHCPGKPKYMEHNGKRIKCCDECTFPHKPENYEIIIKFLTSE